MKKILNVFTLLLIILFFTSCKEQTINKEDVKPTKEFVVSTFIADDQVLLENSELVLSGTSEPGIVIEATIFDENNKVVSSDKAISDNNTAKWSLSLKTPKGNFKKYTIEIKDSYGMFIKTYKNVMFGKLWMLIGDGIIYDELNLEEKKNDEENIVNSYISYLHVIENNLKWINNSENNVLVSKFEQEFADKLVDEYKMPVGIVNFTFNNTNIESFLSQKSINDVSRLKEYLEVENKYIDNPNNISDMCYIYNNYLSKFNGISFDGVLFNHYVDNLDKLHSDSFSDFYFNSLMVLVEDLHKNLNNARIYFLGASSSNNDVICKLRNIQNSVTNYFSYVSLIPTFDLNLFDETNIFNIELNSLVKRVFDCITLEFKFSKYANLVYVTNEEEVVTKIKVEFSSTEFIEILSQKNIMNNELENIEIKYLDIYYEDKKLEKVYTLENNFLVINLEYEVKEEIDGVEVITTKVYEKEKITISYGQYGNLLDYNFINDEDLPIIPFKIKIK